jgi:hypothetical protein
MTLKQINSEINAVTARLSQAKVYPDYTNEERTKLIEKYTAELERLDSERAILVLDADVIIENPGDNL